MHTNCPSKRPKIRNAFVFWIRSVDSYDVSKKMVKLLPTNALTSFQMKCHLCWVQSYLRNEFEFVIRCFFRLSCVEFGCRTRCIGTSDVIAHKLFSLYHSTDEESYASLYFVRWLVRLFVQFQRPTHFKWMLANEIKNYS